MTKNQFYSNILEFYEEIMNASNCFMDALKYGDRETQCEKANKLLDAVDSFTDLERPERFDEDGTEGL